MTKVRKDAKLKSLTPALQAQVREIINGAGITRETMTRLESGLGITVRSLRTLSEFLHWYDSPQQRIAREIETAGSVTALVVDKLRASPAGVSEAELFQMGQRIFAERAIALQDPEIWSKTQAAGRDRERVGLKRDELELARQKFQRETCEAFLKWYEDRQARDIAGSGASYADKIDRLGQLMFGEGWK